MNWTDELLFAIATETASEAEAAAFWAAFPNDRELGARYSDTLSLALLVTSDITPLALEPSRRASFLAAIDQSNRFAPSADTVAGLLDISNEDALVWLSGLDDPANWGPGVLPGTSMWSVPTDREGVGIVWLKMPPGMEFPEHKHLGDEEVLVLQGRYIDHLGVMHPPGTVLREPPETEHSFHIDADGPEFICLAIVQGGIRIGEHDVTRESLYGE
ncbi:MAG: anti-sigma factor ChrR (cupin superfamily) [Bradymonadia bacterium]|jgi:anti-sigma factor ChrR (cupin superfamily)